ncbi:MULTISPECIES: cytochrome b/b6 domain-containing protein [Aphanothece]|uniref:cytochrome b/b6 domain-containing protein n=1 Tax=Aphanothece TaxID=1121 RepID=UPI003984E554
MPPVSPYQPSLLRLLHGAMVVLVPLCWLSGFVVYSNQDGRWGRLAWVIPGEWIDIHGTFGVLLWPLALLFALYALSLGRSRLRQAANAAALIALVLAVGSGKLMNEAWLRSGQLDHLVYGAHLTAWLLIAAVVIWHLTAVLRRGGRALASSMLQLQVRANDQPRHWPSQVKTWFQRRA